MSFSFDELLGLNRTQSSIVFLEFSSLVFSSVIFGDFPITFRTNRFRKVALGDVESTVTFFTVRDFESTCIFNFIFLSKHNYYITKKFSKFDIAYFNSYCCYIT